MVPLPLTNQAPSHLALYKPCLIPDMLPESLHVQGTVSNIGLGRDFFSHDCSTVLACSVTLHDAIWRSTSLLFTWFDLDVSGVFFVFLHKGGT